MTYNCTSSVCQRYLMKQIGWCSIVNFNISVAGYDFSSVSKTEPNTDSIYNWLSLEALFCLHWLNLDSAVVLTTPSYGFLTCFCNYQLLWFLSISLYFNLHVETLLKIQNWKKHFFGSQKCDLSNFFLYECHTFNFDFFWLNFFLRLLIWPLCIFFASQYFSNLLSIKSFFLQKRLFWNFFLLL